MAEIKVNDVLKKASKLIEAKEFESAIQGLTELLGEVGHQADAYQKRAFAYMKMGWFDEAIEDCKLACHFGGGAHEYLSLLGKVYLKKGWFDEAIKYFNLVLEQDESREDDQYCRGIAYFRKGWFNEAVWCFARAIDMNPGDGRYYYSLAVSLRARGEEDNANSYIERAIKLDKSGLSFRQVYIDSLDVKEFDEIVNDTPPSMLDAAYSILKDAGEPLHYKDITAIGLKHGIIVSKGRTPEQTVRSAMSLDMKKGNSRFHKLTTAVYSLEEWGEVELPEKYRESSSSKKKVPAKKRTAVKKKASTKKKAPAQKAPAKKAPAKKVVKKKAVAKKAPAKKTTAKKVVKKKAVAKKAPAKKVVKKATVKKAVAKKKPAAKKTIKKAVKKKK